MVCKKDVVTWFKGLKSYKRIDLMCSLLNLCLPFELRFIGTCLEHLGKRDFHELRQAESEANSSTELNSLEVQCLTSQQLRTKLAVYVSVLYSCNYTCSNSIYKVLTKNDDIHNVLKSSSDETILDDLLLIYILAINHPAFTFEQKLNLEKIFNQLHEEERRLFAAAQTANRTKNYSNTTSPEQLNDKPPTIQGYPACISLEDGHIIGVASPQLTTLPPSSHHPGEQGTGVMTVHDGGGGNGATLRLGYPPAAVPPTQLILNAGGHQRRYYAGKNLNHTIKNKNMTKAKKYYSWAVLPPTQPPGGDSPMASRTSSPCSRPGSPPATQPPQQQQSQRLKFPPPRVPPPGDVVRDTIGKEMPKYATNLQNYSNDQLSRMSDDELRDIGLSTSAITQLRTILTKQILTNGIGPPPPPTPHHALDPPKKKLDCIEPDNMVRRYPIEGMPMYPITPATGILCQPSQCYSCYAVGPRKCVPIHHHYPHGGITLAPPPPPPNTVPQHLHHQTHHSNAGMTDAMRNMRLENEQSSASDTASDHSPPDTPAPQHSDGMSQSGGEDRLGGNGGVGSEERRGGGNSGHGRARGIGRNRTNPPGIQTLPRGRGPNPNHRRRDVSSNMLNGGVDERKVYQQQGGSGNNSNNSVVNPTSGGNGTGEPTGSAPGGYFTGYMGPYLRPAYPAAYPHPTAYVRHAYPTAYHNGDIVYQYPPPGAGGGTFLPPPPPPPSYSPVAPPHQPHPPQVLKSPSCYNCGSQSHIAIDCPEPTIEEVTKQGQYRIDFSTSTYQKQPGDVPGSGDK